VARRSRAGRDRHGRTGCVSDDSVIKVETEVEPPGLPLDPDDDGDPCIGVYCLLGEADETRRAAFAFVPVDAGDDQIAEAMVETMLGAAAMRGPVLLAALRRRVTRGSAFG